MEFLIRPRFRGLRNAIYFETTRLNALAKTEYSDKFGFYQDQFGLYSYMQLTTDLTYRIHYAQGTPFMWQSHNSCAWTPTGTLSMANFEITPCKAKINEQFCYDEWMNSTYRAWLRWSENPTVAFSTEGVEATNELVRILMKNATLGHRMTLVGGKLHSLGQVQFKDGTPARIEEAFRRTAGTCRGWIELLRERGADAGMEHLDGNFIKATDISNDGTQFIGDGRDIVDLYDEIFDASPAPLQDAIIEGGVGGFGDAFYPIFAVAPPEFRAVRQAYNRQKENTLQNEKRITRQEFTISTDGGSRIIYAYFIDDTVVIPVQEISKYDQYLTGASHFAYLTVSGVIQLGANFADLPVVNEREVAVMMQVSEDAEDYGTHKFLAHTLMAAAINDTDYIAGGYTYAIPA